LFSVLVLFITTITTTRGDDADGEDRDAQR